MKCIIACSSRRHTVDKYDSLLVEVNDDYKLDWSSLSFLPQWGSNVFYPYSVLCVQSIVIVIRTFTSSMWRIHWKFYDWFSSIVVLEAENIYNTAAYGDDAEGCTVIYGSTDQLCWCTHKKLILNPKF